MRERAGPQRVTNVELFFDLVYVFAVTQLSHFLLAGPQGGGAVRTAFEAALLLIMVWQLWAYTTWVTTGSILIGSPSACCCSCWRWSASSCQRRCRRRSATPA